MEVRVFDIPFFNLDGIILFYNFITQHYRHELYLYWYVL